MVLKYFVAKQAINGCLTMAPAPCAHERRRSTTHSPPMCCQQRSLVQGVEEVRLAVASTWPDPVLVHRGLVVAIKETN
jgi:hypothetical protein